MNRYTLVPVDYQPDFSDYSLVPVDYDPFSGDDGTGIGGKDLAQADGVLPSGPQQPLAYLSQAPQPQPVQPPQPQAGPQQSARSQPPISLPERTVLGAGAPTVPISGLDESSPANRQQPGRHLNRQAETVRHPGRAYCRTASTPLYRAHTTATSPTSTFEKEITA